LTCATAVVAAETIWSGDFEAIPFEDDPPPPHAPRASARSAESNAGPSGRRM